MNGKRIKEISLALLESYTIPEECPYLSEDQRNRSKLTLAGRAQWMAEWLRAALSLPDSGEEES